MPLLDHFHPPLKDDARWNSFHSNWATRIADQLSEALPDDFRAEEHAKASGGVEIDVASYRRPEVVDRNGSPDPNLTPEELASWVPPPPVGTMPALFPDTFEVRVIQLSGARQLVAAIELVSPGNKDRDEVRRAFATKVASYLHDGISIVVIDVVTDRRANLHNETMRLIGGSDDLLLPTEADLYAVAYRPAIRQRQPVIDLWTATFSVGESLPTLPLRLTGELFVPVDFEASYTEACRRRRLIR
jgi:hypothetical protein